VRTPLAEFKATVRDPRPVSANKLYSGRERFLTKAGERYRDAVAAKVVEATTAMDWAAAIGFVYKSGAWAEVEISLFLPKVYNASWKVGGSVTTPRKRPDGSRPKPQPRSPYQKVDASNYVKLTEDGVARGTGIDDSAHLFVSVRKEEDRSDPRVEVRYGIYTY
jgi:hypothetical protein